MATTSEEKNAELTKIYSDYAKPAGFTGRDQVWREAKKIDPTITKQDVQNFLETNLTYTQHKPKRVRFKRLKTIPDGYMTDLQADLGDFQRLSHKNKGYKYLLLAVDVLTRQVFVSPIKNKSFASMKEGFEEIFQQMPLKPSQIFTDQGREFISKDLREYFKTNDILSFTSSHGAIKAGVAERFIRTIKSRIYKYFGDYQTRKWIDVIHPIARAMNHSYCRVIGMRPIDVTPENAQQVWNTVYGDALKVNRVNMGKVHAPGTLVRIARERAPFHKGYLPTFSEQIYKVGGVKSAAQPITYEIVDDREDEAGTPLRGRFYDRELSKTSVNKFVIEKVMGRRTTAAGVKQVLVKVFAYADPYWVDLDAINYLHENV